MTKLEERLMGQVAHRRILIARSFDKYTVPIIMATFGVSLATAKRDRLAVREAMACTTTTTTASA